MRKFIFLILAFIYAYFQVYAQGSGGQPDTVWCHATNYTVNAVKFTPDGTKLITGGDDGIPRIWDVATGSLIHEFPYFGNSIGYIDVDTASTFIAFSGSWKDNPTKPKFYDLHTYLPVHQKIANYNFPISTGSMSISNDCKYYCILWRCSWYITFSI